MMLIWYFMTVPDLPWEAIDQTKSVKIVEYSVSEGTTIEAGDTIAEVETWWARLRIIANYPCCIEKNLFDGFTSTGGITVGINQPIALAFCDYTDVPKEKPAAKVEVLRFIRKKPKK